MEKCILDRHIFKKYKKQFGKQKYVCMAPFTSLYFKPDGTILPCCALGSNLSFGSYKNSTINEILESDYRKKLQTKIASLDFSNGCIACLKSMNSGNFMSAINTQYRHYDSGDYPEVLEFELSYFCNLDCVMCYLHDTEKVNKIYNSKFVEEITPYLKHAVAVKFLGGEPFLIPIYRQIWEVINENNWDTQVHIQTNGTVFNDEIANIISNLNAYIGISIDGISKESYEKIRRGGNFEKVIENIESFNRIMTEQKKSLSFSFTPMNINWKDIPEFIDFVNSYSGLLYFNNLTTPYKYSFRHCDVIQLKNIINYIDNYDFKFSTAKYYNQNLRTLKSFLNGLQYIINEYVEFERLYAAVPLSEWLKIVKTKLSKESDFNALHDLLGEQYMSKMIMPHIQNKFNNLTLDVINEIINKMVVNKQLNYLLDFLEIDFEKSESFKVKNCQ